VPASSSPAAYTLAVKVNPAAPTDRLVGFQGEELVVKIAAPPEKGKANRELVAFLAKTLGVPKSAITLLRGETSRHKLLRLPAACRETLAKLLPPE
jgi:uncharacterized protein (TIGR00251 family)